MVTTEEGRREQAAQLIQVGEVAVQLTYGDHHTSFLIVWLLQVAVGVVFVMIINQREGMAVIRMEQVARALAVINPAAEELLHLAARLVVPVLFRVLSASVDPCVGTTEVAEGEGGTEAGLLMLQVAEVVPVITLEFWYPMG